MLRDSPRIRIGSILMAIGLFAATCTGGDPTAPMDRDEFIEVMIELRLAAREFTDPSAFDSRKAEILQNAGISDSTLVQFVRAHERDPEYMADIWEFIDEQVNPPAFESDTTGPS